MDEINIKSQKEELKRINNQLSLLMAKKRAIQHFLKKEASDEEAELKEKIIALRDDKDFIEKNGRSRDYWEIGNEVGYSETTIKRIFKSIKKWGINDTWKLVPRLFLFKLKLLYTEAKLWKNTR